MTLTTLQARRGPFNDVELVLGDQHVYVLVGLWQRLVQHLEEHKDGDWQQPVTVSVVVAPEEP